MIFRKNGKMLFEKFGIRTLIFDIKKNLPYVLNDVAANVLMKTDGTKDHKTVAREICEEYHVKYSRAIEDIEGLYNEFIGKELVTRIK
jgi:hypothetical protein